MAAEDAKCTCEYGCARCGFPEAGMGNCPSSGSCSLGRAHDPDCPVHEVAPFRTLTEADARV